MHGTINVKLATSDPFNKPTLSLNKIMLVVFVNVILYDIIVT